MKNEETYTLEIARLKRANEMLKEKLNESSDNKNELVNKIMDLKKELNSNCLKEIETLKAQLQDKEIVIANLNIEVEAKAEYNHDLRVRLDNNAKTLNETTKENQVIHTALYEEQEKNVNLEITIKTLTKMVK